MAAETETSNNTLLQLMTRVYDSTSRWFESFDQHLLAVKSVHHETDGGDGTIASTSLTQGLMADTIFGTGHIGGVSMDLTMNALFAMVRTLEAKVQVLSDRTKNTGIPFGDITYASETEFNAAYHTANPSGAGPAGFVDIISMWQFSAASHSGDASNWLSQERNAKAIGFSKTINAKYAFTMSIIYPSALPGSDKTELSVNTMLNILKSVKCWHGGTGNGAKEKLTNAMTQAAQAHKKYCEEYVPDGWLRDHTIKSGQYTHQFWLSLASYIEDQIILLQTFKLPEKSICLLMSHQVIQIRNDLSEFQMKAQNVSFDSLDAGARYAWVCLQALQCMDGYLQAKFGQHQGINSTFIYFLMQTMADQSAMGLKSNVNKLEKQLKLISKKVEALATKKSYHDLDAKLEGVIHANNLKKKA